MTTKSNSETGGKLAALTGRVLGLAILVATGLHGQVGALVLPAGQVAFSEARLNETAATDPANSPSGFISVTLSGVMPGSSLENRTYAAWCGAWYSSVVENFGDFGFPVYSTYSPTFPAGNKPNVPGNTFNMVNYILNHKQGTVKDVQNAIWLIITGEGELPSSAAGAMAAAAVANPAYVPSGAGAVMAVFYAIGPNQLEPNAVAAANHLQNLLLEVPVPATGEDSDPLTLSCPAGGGQAGVPYSGSLAVGGGIGPFGYLLTGSLPPGLTLNPETGAISGTPGASGSFTFSGQVRGASGPPVTASCSLTIAPPPVPLSLVCPAASTAQVGVSYADGLVASGGTGQYAFSLLSGSLPDGLTLNPETGFISGTPLATGTGSFVARVRDSGDTALSQVTTHCGLSVAAAPTADCLTIRATEGVPIVPVTLIGRLGGGGPYTVSAVGLPAGLSMSESGQISGTPTVNGTFAYTVTVFDKNGNPGTFTCSITVAPPPPPLTLTCPVSTGQINASYSSALTATGGTNQYGFSITAGNLPPGLVLNQATGRLTGTPASGSQFSFTAKVVDVGNPALAPATATCGISLSGAPTSTCVSINATQGVPITPRTLVGLSGGGGPYTFTAISLPAGLVISQNGQISGTPTVSGTISYTVRVTDKNGNSGTFTCSVTICPAAAPLSLVCPKSNGQIGVAYTSALLATGGSGHYAYSILTGALPAGLTLNSVTGYISGTPTANGSFTIRAQADDTGTTSDAPVLRTCSITITPAPSTLCPGVTAVKGSPISPVNLVGSGGAGGPYTFSATGLPAGLTLARYGKLSGIPEAGGTFAYTIRVTDKSGRTGTVACSITVSTPVPTQTPGISLSKTANKTRVNPFEKVTYSYVVKNTGTVALTNVTVVDDNATPGYLTDDFTVGVVTSLAPGASATLTATIYPPVKEDADTDDDDWGYGGWGYRDWDNDYNKYDGGSMVIKELPNGDISFTYRVDKSLTDTTYGRNSSTGWGYSGRAFQGVLNYEGAQFQILDKMGNICLDFVADYLSPSAKYRSGYGSLGIKGGGGMVYKGNAAHVKSVESSLARNLNRQTRYSTSTSDSPREGTVGWEDEQTYTVVISKDACSRYGFGGVKVPKVKNYRSKRQNCESHVAHPASSTVTNKATATASWNGSTVKATDTATVVVDASSRNWSQWSKY